MGATLYVLILYYVPATGLYSNLVDELGIDGKLKQIEPVSITSTNRFKNYAITNESPTMTTMTFHMTRSVAVGNFKLSAALTLIYTFQLFI